MTLNQSLFAADDVASQMLHVFQMLGFRARSEVPYLASVYDRLPFPTATAAGGRLRLVWCL